MAKVGIFGAGWVGVVTGACLADLGHDVVVRDVVPEKVDALRAGTVPFHETDVPELLERNRDRLAFTLDVAELVGCGCIGRSCGNRDAANHPRSNRQRADG